MNELLSMGDGTVFSYDQKGNLSSKQGADVHDYQYDHADRLTHVQLNGQMIDQFWYDGDGRRIKKTEWSESLQDYQDSIYIYRGNTILYEKKPDTGMDALYIYGPKGKLAKKVNGAIYYYHSDHLGTTRLITDENGTVVSQVMYQSFGKSEINGESESYLYTGKELDASQLYYFGARYYDPEIGRFITRDPYRGELDDPQSQNRYAYSLNNPLRFKDTWGLSTSSGDCKCASSRIIKQKLADLDKIEHQIEYLEGAIKKDLDVLLGPGGFDDELNECLDFLNDMGFQIPSLLLNRDEFSAKDMLIKVGEEAAQDAIETLAEKVGMKLISSLLNIFGKVKFAMDLIKVFACINTTWGVGSLQKSIEAYGIMLKNKTGSREKIINDILEVCPCALDPPAPPSDDPLPLPEDIQPT
jgi:RHS repeat-associated protein